MSALVQIVNDCAQEQEPPSRFQLNQPLYMSTYDCTDQAFERGLRGVCPELAEKPNFPRVYIPPDVDEQQVIFNKYSEFKKLFPGTGLSYSHRSRTLRPVIPKHCPRIGFLSKFSAEEVTDVTLMFILQLAYLYGFLFLWAQRGFRGEPREVLQVLGWEKWGVLRYLEVVFFPYLNYRYQVVLLDTGLNPKELMRFENELAATRDSMYPSLCLAPAVRLLKRLWSGWPASQRTADFYDCAVIILTDIVYRLYLVGTDPTWWSNCLRKMMVKRIGLPGGSDRLLPPLAQEQRQAARTGCGVCDNKSKQAAGESGGETSSDDVSVKDEPGSQHETDTMEMQASTGEDGTAGKRFGEGEGKLSAGSKRKAVDERSRLTKRPKPA